MLKLKKNNSGAKRLTIHAYQVTAIRFGLDPARTAIQSGYLPPKYSQHSSSGQTAGAMSLGTTNVFGDFKLILFCNLQILSFPRIGSLQYITRGLLVLSLATEHN